MGFVLTYDQNISFCDFLFYSKIHTSSRHGNYIAYTSIVNKSYIVSWKRIACYCLQIKNRLDNNNDGKLLTCALL